MAGNNSTYKNALINLNSQQRAAVEAIEGPLMVLAGPGTGKTQLLSLRAANILQQADVMPHNILCLTFTEKAASNMKQRMLDIVGVAARNIAVKTFHGLGAQIIAEYSDSFYNSASLDAAPDAVKLEIIDKLLSDLPFSNPLALKFAGQNTLVKDVQTSIDQAKKAGLTASKLEAMTMANLAYIDLVEPMLQPLLEKTATMKLVEELSLIADKLPDMPVDVKPFNPLSEVLKTSLNRACDEAFELGKAKPVTEWKNRWSEKRGDRRVLRDRKRNEWWLSLAGVYESYQTEMHSRLYFDFSDMILDVLTKLETDSSLLTDLQEQYQYIMIDEFQDTNDAQLRLAHLIASNPIYEGRPNIMVVGDDDQAIYRFQGAEITNAKTFLDTYKDTKLIVLKENYRSCQTVINTASLIVQQIENRLVGQFDDISKDIVAVGSSPAGEVEHQIFSTQAHQLSGLAYQADKYLKDGKSVAVLARNHNSLEQLAHVMHKKSVPVHYEHRNNIFENESVKLICDILRLINSISAGDKATTNLTLSKVLANKVFEVDAKVLWQLAVDNKYKPDWLSSLVESEHENLAEIGNWALELAKLAVNEPLMVIIEHVLGLRELNQYLSPVKKYYQSENSSEDNYLQTLSAVQSLRSLVMEFSRNQNPTLARFLDFLNLNESHGVVIADESVFVTNENAVTLMTVYKAKGLEFDVVFVIDCIDKMWSPRNRKRLPPSNLESLQAYGEDSDDYGRLMFVAATRAKSDLIFTSYNSDEHGNEVLSSPLLHEIKSKVYDETELDLVETIENNIAWPEISKSDERAMLKGILSNYQLSVTNLINFIDLENGGPKYFVSRNLLRIPEIKTPSLGFGTAIHDALREAQVQINANKFSIQNVLNEFRKTLIKQQIESSQLARYEQKGEELLQKLFNDQLLNLVPGNTPEKKISDVVIGNAKIKGDIDLLTYDEENVLTVVDYKTGSELKSNLDTQTKTEGMKALKHRLQLIFYTVLLKEKGIANPGDKVVGKMIYLEAKADRDFEKIYQPTNEDIERMKTLIEAVWTKIQNLEWPDISKYSADLSGTNEFINDLINRNI